MNYLSLVQSRFPSNLETDYPIFSYMMLKYHAWLNYDYIPGNALNDYSNLLYQEYTDDEYRERVIADLGFNIESGIDSDLVYQLIDNFFKSKGTVNSFKLLFKLVYGADVEIAFPRDKMLYLSAANWMTTRWLCITGEVDLEETCIYGGIQGSLSKSIAGIESYFPIYIANKRYFMLEISDEISDFTVGEEILIQYGNKKYYEVNVPLLKANISGGKLYAVGDKLRIIGDYSGLYKLKNTSTGKIDSLTILVAGSGYAIGDVLYTNPNNGFFGVVSAIGGSGQITGVKMTSSGRNFTKTPVISIYTSNGVNGKIRANTTNIGIPLEVETKTPSVSISGIAISNVINSTYGTGLVITTTPVATIKRTRWHDKKGMLGYNTLLPDSLHVHEFAYDIISNVSTNQYQQLVKDYVHPIGFTANNINEQKSVTGNITQTGFSFTFSVGP